jgi:protein transport protein DSL1/ZW10
MPLSELLIPRLNSLLISHWLSLNLPTDVKAIQDFKDVLGLTVQFADTLDSYRWCGKDQLLNWANGIPQVWLNKRRAASLNKVRRSLAEGLGESEAVERVETQLLSHGDDVFAEKTRDDDWNAHWSDDEEANLARNVDLIDAEEQPEHGDEEGVNAWGFDDDETNNDSSKEITDLSGTGNDEADAWGWKDEAENDKAAQPEEQFQIGSEKSIVNGHPESKGRPEREVILKETYNITALPKQMFEIITQLIFDAEILRSPM